MSKYKVGLGDLFAVPGTGGVAFGLAKVIFLSKIYKDLMLVRLYRERAADPKGLRLPAPESDSALYYTSVDAVANGGWIHFGKQDVTASERAMTKRVDGEEVWIEDTHLGTATNAELQELKTLHVYGYKLITKAIAP
jgi:hypothetical protein